MTTTTHTSKSRTIIILASGIGISQVGNMVYLVTINIFVFDVTRSAIAISGLWVVSKIAALLVSPWAGSLTDRRATLSRSAHNLGDI